MLKKKKNKKPLILILALAIILIVALIIIFNSGAPKLNDTKKAELDAAWKESCLWHWEDAGSRGCRYYGNYDGYDVVFYPTNTLTTAQIVINEVVFEYNYTFELIAYKDDSVYELKAMFKNGNISADSITEIAHMHNTETEKLPAISDDLKARIEQAWFASERQLRWDTKENQKGSARYYGTHDGFDIFLFVNDVPPNCLSYYSSVIATTRFEFDCSCTLYAYQNGNVYRLRDLYNSGGISAKAVASVAKLHEKLS